MLDFPDNKKPRKGRVPVLKWAKRRRSQTSSDSSEKPAPICTKILQNQSQESADVSPPQTNSYKSTLNPMAEEFVFEPSSPLNANTCDFDPTPQIFVANIFITPPPPALDDPGWVDFRAAKSPSLPSPSLPAIEEEPDLLSDDDDCTEPIEVDDRPARDDDTGRILDDSNRVYGVEVLLAFRSNSICQIPPETLMDSFLSHVHCAPAAIDKAVNAMDAPIIQPPFESYRVVGGGKIPPSWRPSTIKRPPLRPRPRPRPMPPKLSDLSRRKRTLVPPSELEKLLKKTRGILNRIAPDQFDRLSKRLSDLIEEKVSCYEHLEVVLDAILGVAVTQPAFVERYVKLLSDISKRPEIVESWGWVQEQHLDSQKVVKNIVRELCRKLHELYWFTAHPAQQQEWLALCADGLDLDVNEDVVDLIVGFCSDDTEVIKTKKKFFGVEVVMAEMCKQEMMSKGLICKKIINPLLRVEPERSNGCDDAAWRGPMSPEELEAVCKLLTICGRFLEAKAPKWINAYFEVMETQSRQLDSRFKFMVMDLQDLRASNWGMPLEEREFRPARPIHREDVGKQFRQSTAHHQRFRGGRPRARYVPRRRF